MGTLHPAVEHQPSGPLTQDYDAANRNQAANPWFINSFNGVGIGMLQDAIRRTVAIAEQVGVRALLTHPIDEDATRFYLRFGFEASPVREQQLLLLLKDARRLLAPAASGKPK